MWGITLCDQCGQARWGNCLHCNPVATPPASTDPPVDPNNWKTVFHATRNARRLAEEDCERQEEWRRSLASSTSNNR